MELFKRIRNRISLPLAHSLIRVHPNDRFTVSYPRSGSTWLRTILANIMMPDGNGDPRIINTVIPSVSLRRLPLIYKCPRPRIIQSHTGYRKDIPKAVYLLRDGRDVLVSFYHYLVTRYHYLVTRGGSEPALDFAGWFQRYEKGHYGPRWHENIESWLTTGVDRMGDRLLVIKFEELKDNPEKTAFAISQFLGIPADESRITEAVHMASLDQLRQWERKHWGEITDPNASFHRGGRTGQYKDYFTDTIMDRFLIMSEKAMRLCGYL
jgi:hypothetical protein